ncbi:MAG: PSD1 and planctomycete cytochrome C domain-containing protein [Armatimonadota bacterium]
MILRTRSLAGAGLTLAVTVGIAGLAAAALAAPGERVDFGREIRPLLAKQCVACHGPKRQDGGLRLDVRARALLGGDSGPAVVARAPERSELLRRLKTDDPKHRMPLGGEPLAPEQIALVQRWIAAGADWPDALAGREEASVHWSFRPVRRPPIPAVRAAAGVRNPIDAFVLAKLEAKGLRLSPEAKSETLVRRLYLDLVGLPPTPAEVDAYLSDTRPDAYQRLVDTLLASPHFGERWGRHWLDLARFAESDGYENDQIRANAWRYRDWVIQAFNADMPFDRFTVEQLAGDLLPNAPLEARVATGFHRNTLWNSAASADKEEFRTYAVKDRADTTATVWMGLTAGCAKCHSHKYDPITQREYYQLYAFFNRTDHEDVSVPGGAAPALKAAERDTFVHVRGGFLNPGEKVVPGTPAFLPPLKPRGAEADRLDLARWLVSPRHPLTSRVAVNQVWMHLLGNGLVPTPENYGRSGQPPTHPELLDFLASVFSSPAGDGETERQRDGATEGQRDRVTGRIRAASSRGATPPAAEQGSEFIPHPSSLIPPKGFAWSTKALIRLIVSSATYRQASEHREELTRVDPENALLGRQNRFRVEAEIVRDLSLSVSGLLDRKLGGPSIVPPFPEGLLEQRFTNEALKLPGEERHRRGVYIHVQRTLTHPSLAAFDVADGNQACVRRDRSTTPIQALTLLNDPVFVECAQALGKRLAQLGPDRDTRLREGFRLCLSRHPSNAELALLRELVQTQEKLGASEDAVWHGVARTLLNLEELTTRE